MPPSQTTFTQTGAIDQSRLHVIRLIKSSRRHDVCKSQVARVFTDLLNFDFDTVNMEVTGPGGRVDVDIEGRIKVEVKSDLEREIEDAKDKLRRYLRDCKAKGIEGLGIATDCRTWRFFILIDNELRELEDICMVIDEDWDDDTLKEELELRLIVLAPKQPSMPAKAEEIARIFGPGSAVFTTCTLLLEETLRKNVISADPPASTMDPIRLRFERWRSEFKVAYGRFDDICSKLGDGDADRGAMKLFVRHTYLAILARALAAAKVLGIHALLGDPDGVIKGEVFRKANVYIVDDDDYFVWVSYAGIAEDILRYMARFLARFNLETADEDVFREIYEAIVDEDTRHTLGEFYTPKWMARLIIDKTITDPRARVLDPACGSGTFLVEALRKKAELLKNDKGNITSEDLERLLDEIWGMDLNPLAVVLARTNLYLMVWRLADTEEIELPRYIRPRVFCADSLMPERELPSPRKTLEEFALEELERECRLVLINNVFMAIPRAVDVERISELARKFKEILEAYIDVLNSGDEDKIKEFERSVKEDPDIDICLKATFESISKAVRKGRNSLWAYIFRNSMAPLALLCQFDVMVSNPPWLVYREMTKELKRFVEKVWEKYDIGPPSKARTSFDLSIAFLLTCLHYLKPNGKIGFVMPRSVIDGVQHVKFSKALVENKLPFIALEIHDFGNVRPQPFHVHSIAIIGVKAPRGDSP